MAHHYEFRGMKIDSLEPLDEAQLEAIHADVVADRAEGARLAKAGRSSESAASLAEKFDLPFGPI